MSLAARAPRYLVAAAIAIAAIAATARADSIDRQRELFRQVYPEAERGNWAAVEALTPEDQRTLGDYVLWPDLRAAHYRATLATSDRGEITDFLDTYGALRPARDLRYRYALQLATARRFDDYLLVYQRYYQGMDDVRLDCLALRAEIIAGNTERIAGRAMALWMVGRSQVEECDPVFAWLQDNGHLDTEQYAQRYRLAVEVREFTRARWLARAAGEVLLESAERWLVAQQSPEAFVRQYAAAAELPELNEQLLYAIERLAYASPEAALALWKELDAARHVDAAEAGPVLRHVALWTARNRLPGAHDVLAALPEAVRDDEVMRWRARSSLRDQDWARLRGDIALMSEAERSTDTWRYWQAIALLRSGDPEPAAGLLAELATERSYYGFLAADELGVSYALDSRDTVADEAIIAELEQRADIIRARELFFVGLDSRARSEWSAAIEPLDRAGKAQAARLAASWDWHSRAIATAASAGLYDDLALRYPLPYRDTFTTLSGDASIPSTWAYGVARSESLFMPDVRSSAGAIGLMQLMPATGKLVARQLRVPYSGVTSLTDVEQNVRLGTAYLAQMAQRYGGNRVLATAAYNAGPARVDRWLPESGDLDARIWIENIPFNETRAYVRRVLAAETIFHWRLTGQARRLSETLARIDSGANLQRMAQN